MSTTFTWVINQMERLTSDGFVVTVHYSVYAVEGNFYASISNTTQYEQQSGDSYIPYDELTQPVVIGWVQNSVGKDAVEASLQSQIDVQKNPPTEIGVPWATA